MISQSFHQEITTVFLVLPVDQIQEQAKWLRMFVKIAMSQLVRSPPDVAELPPVLFMLDEFGNLGRLPDVLNMLNIGRAQRLQLWMFLQNIDQIKKTNYPDEWTYFFSAAGAKTTFAATDTETGGEWCRMIGKTEKETTSYTKSGGHLLTGYLDPRRVAFSETRAPHVTDLVALEKLARIKKRPDARLYRALPISPAIVYAWLLGKPIFRRYVQRCGFGRKPLLSRLKARRSWRRSPRWCSIWSARCRCPESRRKQTP